MRPDETWVVRESSQRKGRLRAETQRGRMEQLHEAKQKQEEQAFRVVRGWGRWVGARCSNSTSVSSSTGRLEKLPEVQCTQSLDLTCQPKGPGFCSEGAIQGLLALGFRSGFEF